MSFRNTIKKHFPFAVTVYRWYRSWWLRHHTPEQIFTDIYRRNAWSNAESVSGRGSTQASTEYLRVALPKLLNDLGCRSLLDVPCGDFNWMRTLPLNVDYIGADIVLSLVEANQRAYSNSQRKFVHLDILCDPLPRADVVLSRDLLIHFSFADINRATWQIKSSGAHYLLTTSYPYLKSNVDIETGGFRKLNLERAPFNWPSPIAVLEESAISTHDGKFLALWSVNDIVGYG